MKIFFTHIINPVSEKENPELFSIQKTTLLSVKESRKRNKVDVNVELIGVAFPEVTNELKSEFDKTAELSRNVSDLHNFSAPRKLPLIHDILTEGIKLSSGEYIIFTNTDIALMPDFYNVIAFYIEKGHDALVINRRIIPKKLQNAPLEVMQAHAGYLHTGYDCFIFRKSLFPKFISSGVCIGIPPAGNDIFYNIFTFAENPLLLAERHLTFHLGIELVKKWGSKEFLKYNYNEFSKLLKQLEPQIDIAKFPGAELSFFKRHFRWLMNPTFSYPLMFRRDFAKSGKRKNAFQPEVKQKYAEWLIRKIKFKDEE
ncbi:hypothetical protein BH09BAC5_BH09BAC5_25250 [soil metagenome]